MRSPESRESFGKLTLFDDRYVMRTERDYVLGTHDEEIARLGLQHRVWRPVVSECWQRAGITVGKRVLDVGAGPGYATVDLAEIVGPTGEVVALERSSKFVNAMKERTRMHGLTNVKIYELDLMIDDLPPGSFDFTWCRWVLSFVAEPGIVVRKIAGAIKQGGFAIFHEYGHYETWRYLPRLSSHEKFREHVIATWRESGGEPDSAPALPALLAEHGLVIYSARPHLFCIRPNDYMWQWPASFIEIYLPRLQEMGRIDQQFADKFRGEIAAAQANPNVLMVTPLVIEIIAERIS